MDFNCIFVVEIIGKKYIDLERDGQVPILRKSSSCTSVSMPHGKRSQKRIEYSELPSQMMFWIDRNWEGVWLDEVSHKSSKKKSSSCAVFVLQSRIQMLPPSTLNLHREGLNTSVKMQFFTHHMTKPTNTPDFRYMSACPLGFFTEQRQIFRLGLWNFNMPSCDQTAEPLKEYILTIINKNKTQIPSHVRLDYSPHVPNMEHQREMIYLAGWIEKTIIQIFPRDPTIFKVLRTFCRGPWMTLFFFDLHKLYETEDGTNLPPIIALYIVCNACIIHKVALHDFLGLLMDASSSSQIFQPVDKLLTIVRDILMCFTLCGREGKYRDDESMGQVVEDQPFSFAVHRGDNVFDEDDCEGHNQQGSVHVKGLFKHIARDFEMNRLENVRAHIHLPANRSRLAMGDEQVETLLKICVQLGVMFEGKILDALLCVGETNFGSIREVMVENGKNDEAQREGHSFGLLLYRENMGHEIRGARILETTGWENRNLRPQPHSAMLEDVQRAVNRFASVNVEEENLVLPNMLTTEPTEDRLYTRVITGDNIIFFTQRTNEIIYGAAPSHISKYSRNYRGETREQVRAWGELVVLVVSPEEFLSALTRADSPWGNHDGAHGKVHDYLKISEKIPSFHKCAMPPQITEEQFTARIHQNWGTMNEEDLVQNTLQHVENPQILFSCRVDPSTREYSRKIQKLISHISKHGAKVNERDYMQSKIITVTDESSMQS